MDKKYTLYTVTSTHWDREWYMNYQMTRIKLVRLIDNLLDILDNDPDFVSFMMDGQTLPLYDYLEVKPYNRERLRKYIKNGRIVIGPWYILPDEILITGESHIRNYLMGTRIAKDFEVKKMQIGYLPDSFGHPSQMPQILCKLGMDTIVFWRGATEEIDKTEFFWTAPDGSKVLVILMPEGYMTGAELPDDAVVAAKRLDHFIERFAPMASTDAIYLSNGGDHLEPVPYLSRLIRETNKLMKNGKIVHTTLQDFVDRIKESINESDLKVISGELRGTHTAILLASTLSTRTYLKQENHRVSHMLENYLEPIFSMSAMQGNEYPKDILRIAWQYLMQNLPHDSICGCSVDQVHKDMLYRYDQVKEIGTHMLEVVNKFYYKINTDGIGGEYALTVFNTTSNSRTDVVEAVLDFDKKITSAKDYNQIVDGETLKEINPCSDAAKPLPKAIKIFDGDAEIPCKMEKAEVSNMLDLDFYRFPHQYNVNRCTVSFIASDVPALGYKTYKVVPIYESVAEEDEKLHCIELQNQFYKVVPNLSNGTISVLHLKTGRMLTGLNMLADSGDCGDEYSYCPPDEDSIVYARPDSIRARMLVRNSVKQSFEISGAMDLPVSVENENERRTAETVNCAFTTVVTLYSGVERIDVKTTFENKAKYHRLRVLFPSGIKSEYSWSAGIFSVDKRPIHPPVDPKRKEFFSTHPQKDFCDVNDGVFGVTVANRGLHEYEVYDENGQSVIAVTLLRCVEEISRKYIKTRSTMGGWSEKAPEGQCLGKWSFEYSIIPHEGSWEDSKTYVNAHEYNVPMKAFQVPVSAGGTLPATYNMINVENKELVLSAFKACEFDNGYILRFYNTTSYPVKSRIKMLFDFKEVALADLKEEPITPLSSVDNCISIEAKPFEIITLKITG